MPEIYVAIKLPLCESGRLRLIHLIDGRGTSRTQRPLSSLYGDPSSERRFTSDAASRSGPSVSSARSSRRGSVNDEARYEGKKKQNKASPSSPLKTVDNYVIQVSSYSAGFQRRKAEALPLFVSRVKGSLWLISYWILSGSLDWVLIQSRCFHL